MTTDTVVILGYGASAIANSVAEIMSPSSHLTLVVDSADVGAAEVERRSLSGESVLIDVDFTDLEALESRMRGIQNAVRGIVFAQMYFNLESRKQFSFEDWNRSLAVNLTAPLAVAKFLEPAVTDSASFVVVTSTEAYRGSFRASAYAATKAAVHNLVMTLANNAGPRGTRFNAVAPGWIGGVMDTDEVFEMSKKVTPLGRLGSPQEVANVVRFLISSESSFVNGTVVVVDGGYLGVDGIAKYEAESTPE